MKSIKLTSEAPVPTSGSMLSFSVFLPTSHPPIKCFYLHKVINNNVRKKPIKEKSQNLSQTKNVRKKKVQQLKCTTSKTPTLGHHFLFHEILTYGNAVRHFSNLYR